MSKVHEIDLGVVEVPSLATSHHVILGIELQNTTELPGEEMDFLETEWVMMYARYLVGDQWELLPQTIYDCLDDLYGDQIGDALWMVTAQM